MNCRRIPIGNRSIAFIFNKTSDRIFQLFLSIVSQMKQHFHLHYQFIRVWMWSSWDTVVLQKQSVIEWLSVSNTVESIQMRNSMCLVCMHITVARPFNQKMPSEFTKYSPTYYILLRFRVFRLAFRILSPLHLPHDSMTLLSMFYCLMLQIFKPVFDAFSLSLRLCSSNRATKFCQWKMHQHLWRAGEKNISNKNNDNISIWLLFVCRIALFQYSNLSAEKAIVWILWSN